MKHATSTTIATVLTFTLAAATIHADGFDQPPAVGSAGRVYGAAGTCIPVFDDHGQRTGEKVFLLHGGYPPQLNPEPVSDLWALDDGYWQHLGAAAPAMADHALVAAADGRAWAVGAIGEDGWLRPMTTLTTFEVRRVHGRLEIDVQSIEVPGPAPDACFGQAYAPADGGRSILSVGGSKLIGLLLFYFSSLIISNVVIAA